MRGTLANTHRPKKFAEVSGQEAELEVLKTIMEKGWRPPAICITGPFGTGKTTFARLSARALLCRERKPPAVEPCGTCTSCTAIDNDNHPSYIEVDAASQGSVESVRSMKETASYRTTDDHTIICYDESHMLSNAAQNALLQILEEGAEGVTFIFATTEANKMLATVRSRCIELNLKLLTVNQIKGRLEAVCEKETITHEGQALALIATYAKGHMRDALQLLEQLARMSDSVTEGAVRTYLRTDRYNDVYNFLTLRDPRDGFARLEELLCTYSAADLTEIIGTTLLEAYKLKLGLPVPTQADAAWLQRVLETQGDQLLERAERTLSLNTDFATINYALACIGRIFFEKTTPSTGVANPLLPGATTTTTVTSFRKPGKDATG